MDDRPSSGPADLHQWVSFDDPTEARTWVFDLTFLASNWTCVFGRGCPGVLDHPAPELAQGCCTHGAHFTDDADRERVEAAVARLDDDAWQFRRRARRAGGPIRVSPTGETTTRVTEGACILLNRPGFPSGAGCALHGAALRAGERPLDWKPDVCWQLPLRRVDETDPYGHVTSTVREWKRRDWGPGGDDFSWWCTDSPDAFVAHRPVYETLRDELVELVGEWAYGAFLAHARSLSATTLAHPAAPTPVTMRPRRG
jgi:hypothetical protein